MSAWLALLAALGFARHDFTGDGLRHIPSVLKMSHPVLGEARWLLFPTFVFAIVRPLFLLGIVHDAASATRPILVANLLLSGVYVASLRRCLMALGTRPWKRAAALILAGGSAALFFPAFDITEPMTAAAIALAGIAFAAKQTNDPAVSTMSKRRAVLLALAAVAVAALFYQGVALAAGLIPIVVSRNVLRDRRTLVFGAAILAVTPIVVLAALTLAGHHAGYALARVVTAEDNVLYKTYLKRSGLGPHLVALVGGPPQGLVLLQNFHGFNGLLAGLRSSPGRSQAFLSLALLGFAWLILASGVLAALRRRDWALLVGFALLLVLPVCLRQQQYGYLKFYVLLPFLLAVGATSARPALVWLAAACLLFFHISLAVGSLKEERASYADRMPVYEKAGAASCWITPAWVPRFYLRWPGAICPVLGKLASGVGDDAATGVARNSEALVECLDACFCRASAVYTDDMVEAAKPNLIDSERQFQFSAVDLTALVLRSQDGTPLTHEPGDPVLMYPPAEQRRLCGVLHGQAPAGAR